MNEQEREKMDSLIHGFLDGELTQRQMTELKRLAQHNPAIKKELHGFYRQKELLSALPVEKAPKELAEGVRWRLERRMILESETAAEIRPVVQAHLLLRRIGAVAAMLFLPLGILGLLLFQIMKPTDEAPVTSSPVVQMDPVGEMALLERNPQSGNPEGAAPISLGHLTLVTDQPIAVNDQIKQAIFSNQLITATRSERNEGNTVYRIQCRHEQMLSFGRDLEAVWPSCSQQQLSLSVGDPSTPNTVVIEKIKPEQMNTLIGESNPVRLQMIASYMERLNQLEPAESLRSLNPGGKGTGEPVLQPVEPKIAWDEGRPDKAPAPSTGENNMDKKPDVLLILEVKSAIRDQ